MVLSLMVTGCCFGFVSTFLQRSAINKIWLRVEFEGQTFDLCLLSSFFSCFVPPCLSSKCYAVHGLPPGLQTKWHYWQLFCQRHHWSHQHIWWKICTGMWNWSALRQWLCCVLFFCTPRQTVLQSYYNTWY